jgi:hypothetical protein
MRFKSSRLLAVGIALGAGVLLSACSGQNADAHATGTTVNVLPKDQAQQQLQASGNAVGRGAENDSSFQNGRNDGGSTVEQQSLRFPGTTQIVQLTGYDAKLAMVEFRLVHWIPGGPNNGHYEEVTGVPGMHRLPLAASPTVLSAANLCPADSATIGSDGLGNKPCSKDQLLTALKDGKMSYAQIQVDDNDHIAKVSELYTP